MSRYRPPAPKRSPYITPEGAKTLQEELDFLWREERPRVTKAVGDAAAEGDRSENAEYIYGKRRLRQIDSRVRFLRKRLEELIVVQPGAHENREKVFFGAWVRLEDADGEEKIYRLVGPDEFNAESGQISIDSPIGKALMRRSVGDEIRVMRPKGAILFDILEISYEPLGAPGRA